ncbi:MAG: O-antigen ligase family protein [Planctomycetota bacterium]
MTASSPSLPRRLIVMAALLVPLVVDPFGGDTQSMKGLVLALCGSLALVIAGIEALSGKRHAPPGFLPEQFLALLCAWAALSLLWATNPGLGVARVLLLLGMLGIARTVREACTGPTMALRWVIGMLAVGALAMALDAVLVARAMGHLDPAAVKYASVLFVHNNMAASYVTLLAPLATALVLGTARAAPRLLWGLFLAGLLGYMLLLRSRAGMIGATLGITTVGVLHVLRPRVGARVVPGRGALFVAVLVVALGAVLPFSDKARGLGKDAFYRVVGVAGLGVGDAAFRTEIWGKTIPMIRSAPLTGVGAGNWVVEFPRYEHYPELKPHAHNDMLQVLAELGLPGLLLCLGMLAATLLSLLRVLGSHGGKHHARLAAGLLGVLIVLAVSGVFEVPLALGSTAGVVAVLIGLAGTLDAPNLRAPRSAFRTRALAVAGMLIGLPACWLAVERLPSGALARNAEQHVAAGRPAEAARLYETLAARHTGTVQPHERLADLALERGDGEAALVHAREARRLWPYQPRLAEREGDVLVELDRPEEAVLCYREALELSPARKTPFYKLVRALDEAGHLDLAIDELEYEVRVNTGITLGAVANLAEMLRRRAEETDGDERTRALVAARHFYAVLLEDGPPENRETLDATFKDVTHRLQILPGGLDAWWADYQRFLEQGGWNMPSTALYTSTAPDGIKLFPGWDEPYGPPEPGSWRRP